MLQRTNEQGGEFLLFFLRSCRAQTTPQLLLQGSCRTLCPCPTCTVQSSPAPAQLCPSGECLPPHEHQHVPNSKNNMEFLHGRASAQSIQEQIPSTKDEIIYVASHVLCPFRSLFLRVCVCVKNNGTTKKFYRLC